MSSDVRYASHTHRHTHTHTGLVNSPADPPSGGPCVSSGPQTYRLLNFFFGLDLVRLTNNSILSWSNSAFKYNGTPRSSICGVDPKYRVAGRPPHIPYMPAHTNCKVRDYNYIRHPLCFTYLTPRRRIVFENIIVAQLLKKFDAFYKERRLAIVLGIELITTHYANHTKHTNAVCG